jgi:hypothetical protein
VALGWFYQEETAMKHSAQLIGIVIVLTVSTATVPRALAQSASSAKSPVAKLGVTISPQNKQDQGQQAKDENECYGMAKQQSGVDPATMTAQQAPDAKGAGAKGAAKGAAVGAIAGDAGAGAAVGAVHGRRKQKRAERKADDQAQTSQQSMDGFKKSFSSCMTTRKYAVQ